MAETKPRAGALRELRRLVPYLKNYKTLVFWGLVFITASNICSTSIPRIIGHVIDALKLPTISTDAVSWLLLQVLGLTIGSGLFMFATRRTIIVMSRRIEEDLRNDYVNALQNQAQKFYHDRSTGSLLALFTNDIGAVREFIGPAVMYTANTITTFAFALTWMIMLNGWLTLAIVVPVPIIALVTYRLGKKIHENYRSVQEQYELVTTHAQETFSGVRVVRAYSRQQHESDSFKDINRNYYARSMRLARVNSLLMPSMMVLFNLTYLIVLGVGGYSVITSALTIGQLTQFFIYLNQLLWPIAAIGWVTGMIQRGAASMGRLGAIIDHVPVVRNADNVTPLSEPLKGIVTFDDVSLVYSGQRPVLDHIALHVPAASSLGIVGQVGSGKTSLVNLIPRLYDVTTGTVMVDGVDVRELSLEVLRGGIAVVPQESFLFSETIRENIRFGRPAATDDEVLAASRIAQLDPDVQSLPNGYDTIVGERGITLSGGQKQRTAMARAILARPAILILDDSLSAVDTDTESRILDGLKDVMIGRTTILIAHRISTIKGCDSIIVLDRGRIVEEGSHDELLALRGLYADMFERQQLEELIA
ncbi:MAG: ABC transporter ATP-binding protein [bacterium]|nr:ABC transporter ATP-binding protein [bacterium]